MPDGGYSLGQPHPRRRIGPIRSATRTARLLKWRQIERLVVCITGKSVGSLQRRNELCHLLHGDKRTADYTAVASVVFNLPALAKVGLLESEARETGVRFEVRSGDTTQWCSSRRVAEQTSGYKVLVEEGSGRTLGAHLLGSHAEELINLFSLAVRFGIKAADLKRMPYAYPSRGSDIPYMV